MNHSYVTGSPDTVDQSEIRTEYHKECTRNLEVDSDEGLFYEDTIIWGFFFILKSKRKPWDETDEAITKRRNIE